MTPHPQGAGLDASAANGSGTFSWTGPYGRWSLAALVGCVLSSAGLAAADDASLAATRHEPGQIHVVPAACREYLRIPDDARDPALEWEQALSFAACLQGGRGSAVSDPGQLESLVEELTGQLDLSMLIYLEVLANSPAPIQLRAAFHVGMAQLAVSTRARSAIAAPPDLTTNPAAAARYLVLHARLEPLLARARRAAWISFAAIDEASAQNPALASDAVARYMIRTAREMLGHLRDAAQVRSR